MHADAVWYCIVDLLFAPAVFDISANHASIAVAHSLFNVACTILLLPASSLLEKIAYRLIPQTQQPSQIRKLDPLLLNTPTIALERSRALTNEMAEAAIESIEEAMNCLFEYSPAKAKRIIELEDYTDKCEEEIGDYLVKLSENRHSSNIGTESAMILKIIGDLERLGDHAVNILESAEEIKNKKIVFTPEARDELMTISSAVSEILTLTKKSLITRDMNASYAVDPLEEIIDSLREKLRSNHILRMQRGECSIAAGFVWSDILTNLERISDHSSNIALSMIDSEMNAYHGHESNDKSSKDKSLYNTHFEIFKKRYLQ